MHGHGHGHGHESAHHYQASATKPAAAVPSIISVSAAALARAAGPLTEQYGAGVERAARQPGHSVLQAAAAWHVHIYWMARAILGYTPNQAFSTKAHGRCNYWQR
jgi:hypothetical protein